MCRTLSIHWCQHTATSLQIVSRVNFCNSKCVSHITDWEKGSCVISKTHRHKAIRKCPQWYPQPVLAAKKQNLFNEFNKIHTPYTTWRKNNNAKVHNSCWWEEGMWHVPKVALCDYKCMYCWPYSIHAAHCTNITVFWTHMFAPPSPENLFGSKGALVTLLPNPGAVHCSTAAIGAATLLPCRSWRWYFSTLTFGILVCPKAADKMRENSNTE